MCLCTLGADTDGSGSIEFAELERTLRADFGGDDIIKLATRGPEKSGMRLLTRPQSSPAVSRSAAVLGNRAAHNTGAGARQSQSHARLRPATALPKVGASLPSIGL